jgi:hypothetical protein
MTLFVHMMTLYSIHSRGTVNSDSGSDAMAANDAKLFGALLNGVAKRVIFADASFTDTLLKQEIYPALDDAGERSACARTRTCGHALGACVQAYDALCVRRRTRSMCACACV